MAKPIGGGDKSKKQEGFLEKAKHALDDAIYGHAPKHNAKPVAHAQEHKSTDKQVKAGKTHAPNPLEKPPSKAPAHEPLEKPSKGREPKPLEKPSQGSDKQSGAHPNESSAQRKADRTPKSGGGLDFKQVANYLTDSTKANTPTGKLLKELKSEATTVLHTVDKVVHPLQESLKAVSHELQKKEQVIENALLNKHPEKRQPRQMTEQEAKREERIASMKPDDRARFKVMQCEDPKTHVVYNYDKKGLLTESETLNGQRKHFEYKAGSKEPVAVQVTQNGTESKPLFERKADANHRIHLDQRTGDVKVDSKQKSADGKTQNVEEHLTADGSHSKIVSQNGHRLSKEIYAPSEAQFKKVARLDYQYTDEKHRLVPPEKVDSNTKCTVTQKDAQGAVTHQFDFKSANDVKTWKPSTQTDVEHPHQDADGIVRQRSRTYDCTKGKALIAETDIATTTKGDTRSQKTDSFKVDHGKRTEVSSADVTAVTNGSVTTQTTENYEYVEGKKQIVFHSKETLDKANGNSSSEAFSYNHGKIVAKDFARKEVSATSGDTNVSTTAVRNEKIVDHRQAQFDGKGNAVSLTTKEGDLTYEVKFAKDGKVETQNGKPVIFKDGKQMSVDGLSEAEKNKAQNEMKRISENAIQYMQETRLRYDVRAQVKLTQADNMCAEEENRRTAADRVKTGKEQFVLNGVENKCDKQGRIIEQVKDNVSITLSYDDNSFNPSHVTIKPPGTADGGEYQASDWKKLQINQGSGAFRITELNAKGLKVSQENYAPADNKAAKTSYSYLDKDNRSTDEPEKIDPDKNVTVHVSDREGRITDHYVFADVKHATVGDADQHIKFDPKSGECTKMELRVKAPRGGDSLLEYTVKDGKVTATQQDGRVIKGGDAEQSARIEAYVKNLHEQYYPKETAPPQLNQAKTDGQVTPPRVLTEDDKAQLREKAKALHYQAGYEWGFRADQTKIEEILKSLKDQTEIDEFKRQYSIANDGADLEQQLQGCKCFQKSGAFHLQALLSKDDATITACEVRRALQEQQETFGRSAWEVNTDLRKTLLHLDSKQMQAAQAKFQELFPKEGSMNAAILSYANVQQEIKDALPYLAKGSDKLTSQDRLDMSDIAVKAKNLDMFKEVAANFDDKTRAAYNASLPRQNMLEDAFSGQKLEQARAVALDGVNVIAQEVRDNVGLTTNREGVRNALAKLTDEQRRQYAEGKDLENKTGLTEEQNKSVRLYKSLHGAIYSSVSLDAERQGLEDHITLKGGGLISEISKGRGYIYNTGTQGELDKVANMSEADWQKLHDYVKGVNGPAHPEYRKELEKTLRDMQFVSIQDADVSKILALYDRKIGASTFSDSRLLGQKDVTDVLTSQLGYFNHDRAGALDAIAKMTPDEQRRYRTDSEFRKTIDNQLERFKQISNTDAYGQAERMLAMYKNDNTGVLSQFRSLSNQNDRERQAFVDNSAEMKKLQDSIEQMPDRESKRAAQRMLNQLRDGRQPEMMDVFAKLAGKRSQWFGDAHATINDMETAFKDDPSLLKRVQNPQTEEDRKMAAQFKELSNSALGDFNKSYGEQLINSHDGRLALDQKLEMHKGWIYTDRQGIISDLANASESEKAQLKDRNSPLRQKVESEMNAWMRLYPGMTERDQGQQQVVDKILQTGKVETADKLRSYMLDVGYSSNIMELLKNTPPDKLDQLRSDYFKTYHRDLHSDLIAKLGKNDSVEAMNLFYKPTSAEDLYRHLLDQYLDTRAGAGSAFSDTVGHSGTGYQLDNSINQITAMISEAHRGGKPLSPDQERLLLGHVNTAVETFTKDLSNFKESKSACAEYTSQGVMAALTVAGALLTGGGSLVAEGGFYAGMETTASGLEIAEMAEVAQGAQTLSRGAQALNYIRTGVQFAQSAPGNALMNTGLQMTMLGNDYDYASIPSDLISGYSQGKIFEFTGGTQLAGLLRMGEGTAARTTEAACATLLKDETFGLTKTIATTEARLTFQTVLKREMGNSIRDVFLQGGTELAPGAIRTATGKALREALEVEIKHNVGKVSKQELEKQVKQELERLAEEKVGPRVLKNMRREVEEQVRQSCSKLTPTRLEERIEQALKQRLSEVASGSCEPTIAASLLEASRQQTKGLFKGLMEFSGENSHLVLRTGRGMAMSALGAGTGGTASGALEGLINWDRSKTFEENMTAMREHITGSIYSSIIGAAQMHPLGMIGHHFQTRANRPTAEVMATTVTPSGELHRLNNGATGFTEYSGGQMVSRDNRVVSIRDAEGGQTRILYDQSGAITQLDINSAQGAQRWTGTENGGWKVETAKGSFETKTKINVESDGRLVFQSEDGTRKTKHLDGSLQLDSPDGTHRTIYSEQAQRNKFENLLTSQMSDRKLHARLLTDMDVLSERIITTGKDRAELAKTYAHINEMLIESLRPELPAEQRQKLQQTAEEILWMAAHPTMVSQGRHPTCPLASAESRAYTKYPAETARIMEELATTGEYRCPDGTVLKPFTASGDYILTPDADALSHYAGPGDRADGRRLFSSQMFQTLLVSAHYADHESYNGEFIGKGNIGYLNDHIVDMRTNPPRVLCKEEGSQMYPSEVTRAFEKLTGRHEDFVLLNRRYGDSLNIDPNYTFSSAEELGAVLFGNHNSNRLPISIQLNTFHEPFYTDSGAHLSNGEGGEHVVNVVKIEVLTVPGDPRSMREISPAQLFDPLTGKLKVKPEDVVVSVTNQWNKASNHITKKIPLSELYRATTNPLDTNNLKVLEAEIQKEPNNLSKQLDLLRYKHEFENQRENLSDKAAANPTGPEATRLSLIDPARDCVTANRLIEEIDKLTDLKIKEMAARPRDIPTKEDVAMLDKARGLLESAKKDLLERATNAPTADAEAPLARQNRSNEEQRLLRARIQYLEAKLDSHRKDCLYDAKVPGTLSEFGFEYTLANALSSAKETDEIVTAFIDLNNFKNVNEFHSMDMGDQALRVWGDEAAKILDRYGIKPAEAMGHFGGDEFGILLKNRPDHAEILDEIMHIRVGCKPLTNDPNKQATCDFVILDKGQQFVHTSYKTNSDTKLVTEHPSPVISATLGAVKWEPGMSAEDVLQTADKVMFEKKPLVKERLSLGKDAAIDPFSKTVDLVRNAPESDQLRLFRQMAGTQRDFSWHGMSNQQLREYANRDLAARQDLYFNLLYKHRHTGILDRVKSKEKLSEYITAAENAHAGADGHIDPPFTIIRLAIDNFKPVNDKMQSHAKGNRVLREVGDFIRTLDADFVGSLGGTSPFLIVKDPIRAAEILEKCDQFFLRVSAEKADPEKVERFKDVTGNDIAVGLSAGKVQWHKGMDVETLLIAADKETEAVQKTHRKEGRHTSREQANETKEREDGEERRQSRSPIQDKAEIPKTGGGRDLHSSDPMSLAQNIDHFRKRTGNRPDVAAGNWTYADVDTTKRTVTEKYMETRMHVREAIRPKEGIENSVESYRVHPFFDEKTMDKFAIAVSPMLDWVKESGPNQHEVLNQRRQLAETAINKFLQEQNLPPITLETGPEAEKELSALRGKAGYCEGKGKIMVRSADLLNAGDPAFIGVLYHEILHAEQDVAMIRASALDTVQAKRARAAEQNQSGGGQRLATTGDDGNVDPNLVRRQYSKTRGHANANWDPTSPETDSKKEIAAWFKAVVTDERSRDWIKIREHLNKTELLDGDSDYKRADWLRKGYLTGDASEKRRTFAEDTDAIDGRLEKLADTIDKNSTFGQFAVDEASFLKRLKESAAERKNTYGYDPLDEKFDTRDRTFENLLKSDAKFAELVQQGDRARWIPAYQKHLATLDPISKECEAEFAALQNHPDIKEYRKTAEYKLRMAEINDKWPQDGPRTLQLLARWELKGLIHGMEARNWRRILSKRDEPDWNYAMADHIQLVMEDALNQKERIRYSTTMRKSEEQEAYAVTQRMTDVAARRKAALHEPPSAVRNRDSSELPSAARNRDSSELPSVVRNRDSSELPSARGNRDSDELPSGRGNSNANETAPADIKRATLRKQLKSLDREELQLLAGGQSASAKNVDLIVDTLSIAGDRLTPVIPSVLENQVRLQDLTREQNLSTINSALADIAKYTGEPPLEVDSDHSPAHTTADNGSYKLSLSEDALLGRIPMNEMLPELTEELSKNMQRSLLVRRLASNLDIDKNSSPDELLRLQIEYKKQLGESLQPEYLLSALKNERPLSDGEKLRAQELIESFASLEKFRALSNDKLEIDSALQALSTPKGAAALMDLELELRRDPNFDAQNNSLLLRLFPNYGPEQIDRWLSQYAQDSTSWQSDDARSFWQTLLTIRQDRLRESIVEFDEKYQVGIHETEYLALQELVGRALQIRERDRWQGRKFDEGKAQQLQKDNKFQNQNSEKIDGQ